MLRTVRKHQYKKITNNELRKNIFKLLNQKYILYKVMSYRGKRYLKEKDIFWIPIHFLNKNFENN